MNSEEQALRKRIQQARLLYRGAWLSRDVVECIRTARRVDNAERALKRYLGEGDDA